MATPAAVGALWDAVAVRDDAPIPLGVPLCSGQFSATFSTCCVALRSLAWLPLKPFPVIPWHSGLSVLISSSADRQLRW